MVAQIYGVGLITSRFTGLEFGIGVFVGLGGILVCSFLGGMRAVTWTQVAQYIILIIAYLTPVVWLCVKHTGIPIPQIAYGQVLQKVTEREKKLTADPKELEVRKIFKDARRRGQRGAQGLRPRPTPTARPTLEQNARRPEGRQRAGATRSRPPRRRSPPIRRTWPRPRRSGTRTRAWPRAPRRRGRTRSRSRARMRRRRTPRGSTSSASCSA